VTNPIDTLTQAIETGRHQRRGRIRAGRGPRRHRSLNWRYTVNGAPASRPSSGRWYGRSRAVRGDPPHRPSRRGARRVRADLVEDGEPHMCHQAHHIEVQAGLITRDRALVRAGGGAAALQAEMAEAARL